jgi:hypothetical protein
LNIFVCNAREDLRVVDDLTRDLHYLGHDLSNLFVDRELLGGDEWWDLVVRAIRGCDRFIFALSPSSLSSRACLAELDYASDLQKPIIPVVVSETDHAIVPRKLEHIGIIEYRNRSLFAINALQQAILSAQDPPQLATPPAEPESPLGYLKVHRDLLDKSDLSLEEQEGLLDRLRVLATHERTRTTAIELLREFRRRPDTSQVIAPQIDDMLTNRVITGPKAEDDRPVPGLPPDPSGAGFRIFISYRRGDSDDATGRIFDRLAVTFGEGSIFLDVDSIPLGLDFREYIHNALAGCDVTLVVIGKGWLKAKDASGRRRLDDENDFVRVEVEASLHRAGQTIPITVQRARLPRETNLPPSIGALAYRNAMPVRSGRDFNTDITRLIRELQRIKDGK